MFWERAMIYQAKAEWEEGPRYQTSPRSAFGGREKILSKKMFSQGSSRPQRKEQKTKPRPPSLCPLNNVTTVFAEKAINDWNQITRKARSPPHKPHER